jgi:hypothetical protein
VFEALAADTHGVRPRRRRVGLCVGP